MFTSFDLISYFNIQKTRNINNFRIPFMYPEFFNDISTGKISTKHSFSVCAESLYFTEFKI